jgi:hypothetical protein
LLFVVSERANPERANHSRKEGGKEGGKEGRIEVKRRKEGSKMKERRKGREGKGRKERKVT